MLEEVGVQVKLCYRVIDTRNTKADNDQPLWKVRLPNDEMMLYDEVVDKISHVRPKSYVLSTFLTESSELQAISM